SHLLDRRERLTGGCSKGGEIVFTKKFRGCQAHGVAIQGAEYPAHPMGVQARSDGRFEKDVGVAAANGTGTRMKLWRYLLGPLHCDVWRQEPVRAAHPGERISGQVGIKMDNLHQPVYARVGATSTQGAHGLIG